MPENFPKIFIIVLNWNNIKDTLECLESVTSIAYPNFETVFVDNHSTDNSFAIIREKYPNIHLIQNEANLGFAEGNNRGIEYSLKRNAKYVFLLNNDTVVDKNCLIELVNIAEKNPSIGALGPLIYDYFQPGTVCIAGETINWVRGKPSYKRYTMPVEKEVKDMFSLTGSAIMARDETIKKVGMLDKKYFLFYEDTDWCCRIRAKGFRTVLVPSAKVWHKESKTTGWIYTPTALYFGTRNRLLFMKENANKIEWYIFLIFVLTFSVIRNLYRFAGKKQERKWFIKGLVDFWKGNFGKGSWNENSD
jgi:hypothetical protein